MVWCSRICIIASTIFSSPGIASSTGKGDTSMVMGIPGDDIWEQSSTLSVVRASMYMRVGRSDHIHHFSSLHEYISVAGCLLLYQVFTVNKHSLVIITQILSLHLFISLFRLLFLCKNSLWNLLIYYHTRIAYLIHIL